MDIENRDFLIIGQLKTSRTETLESYLKDRARSLVVVGFMSPFASHKEARCTLYEGGIKTREFGLPTFCLKRVNLWNEPLICISFFLYVVSFVYALVRLRRKFDIVIGIATFPAFLGLMAKKSGVVQKAIYYCLDYYPKPRAFSFNRIVNFAFRKLDARLVRYVDLTWELSPRIQEGRERFAGVPRDSYRKMTVPLGYMDITPRSLPLSERERWTLGFVGTLSENQGLQLVIEAMPQLREKFPGIKVRVIGHGPSAGLFKSLVKKYDVEDNFIFHGFIRDDAQVYEILSRCMAGLATWTGGEEDNSRYADPGKPKLYALLGLPIIITSSPYVSQLIAQSGAGEVIGYSPGDFIRAAERILTLDIQFENYRVGIEKFLPFCLSDRVFAQAFCEAL